jgi:Lipocalin-like domain
MLNSAQQKLAVGKIASQIVGVWTLLTYTEGKKGREDTHPLGPSPVGFLIYTPNGFVSAQLMKPGRSSFQSRDWHLGTPEEYVESGRGYIAYCGRYQVDEANQTVTHIPSVALLPNLINERQLRAIKLNGDRLTLRTSSLADADGVAATSHLEWQRAAKLSEST